MFGGVGANGTNPWDLNDTEGNGTNVPGHSPHLYASGTAATTTVVSGPNSTFNTSASLGSANYAGMEITNTTQLVSTSQHPCSRIVSNTSTSITFNNTSPDGPTKTFIAGEGFSIYKPLIVLDQPGRGQCADLLDSSPPVNPNAANGSNWPHQALEPIYGWNNTITGSSPSVNGLNEVGSEMPQILENRDYYNQNDSFNGTAGIGIGTKAQMTAITNPTPGVAFWVTDEADWDSTHAGPDGQLYVANSSNQWTLKYTPYTYPHPLVTGVPAPPTAPKNLRVAP